MDISNIYQQYYSKANIYSIDPKFIIDFSINSSRVYRVSGPKLG